MLTLSRLLIVAEHNKIRRHRTLDLLVDSDFFIPNEMISTEQKFFNYDDLNITIGPDHQIPSGTDISYTEVKIKNITAVYDCGQRDSVVVMSFNIDKNGTATSIPVLSYAKGYTLSKSGKDRRKNWTILNDEKFEKTKTDVRHQIMELRKNPDYQLASIDMTIDALHDPPENHVEVWVYKSTPENQKLDKTLINGWMIRVYPLSQHTLT